MKILNGLINIIFAVIIFLMISGGLRISFLNHTISLQRINTLVLICVLLITIRKIFFKHKKLEDLLFMRIIKKLIPGEALQENFPPLLIVLFFSYAFFFTILTILKTITLDISSFDLAIYSQAVWNTTQGNLLYSSIEENVIENNVILLGDHFSPILLLLAPLYWLYSSPSMLLGFQSFALASGIFPIFWLAKEKLKDNTLAFVFCCAYLFYPPLRFINLFEFHPIALVIPLYLYAFYYLTRDNFIFLLFLGLAFLCKEEVSLINMFFGLYMLFFTHHKRLGIFISLFSLGSFFIVIKCIIPYFSHHENYHYFSSRYYHLGNTLGEVFKMFFTRPLFVIEILFRSSNFQYIWKIFRSIGMLSFLSPSTLMLTVPTFLINCLTFYEPQQSLRYQYVSGLLPFVFISAIYGASHVIHSEGRFFRIFETINRYKKQKFVIWLVLVSTFAFYGRSPVHELKSYLKTVFSNPLKQMYDDPVFKMIHQDKTKSVTVPTKLTPLFSTRKLVYQNSHYGKTDFVILNKTPDPPLQKLLSSHYILLNKNEKSSLFIYGKLKNSSQ